MSDYPTDEQLYKIENWPLENMIGLAKYVVDVWNVDYGMVDLLRETGTMTLITGGWSGNEEILSALEKNMFWSLFWKASYRGGRVEFDGIRELE